MGPERMLPAGGVALFTGLLLGAPGCAPGRATGPEGQPNILVVVVDCLRADRVDGSHRRLVTPAMHALAAGGTRFDRAFAQASWTRPSVATLLTGLYPSEHGLGNFETHPGEGVAAQALSPEVLTLAEALRASGYATLLVADQAQLSRQFALDQGFDLYTYRTGRASTLNARFLAWLDGVQKRPFFAYLHYLDIHWPFCPPALTRRTFQDGTSQIDFCADWRTLDRDIHEGRVALGDADRQAMRDRYDEELLDVDARLGDLFAMLDQRGLWDETLVVLTADHGEEFFEHGQHGHGQSLHDELTRVPLVVRPPASWPVPRGRSLDFLVELRDVVPTLLEAAGVTLETPGGGAPSLLGWVRGGSGNVSENVPHRYVIAEGLAEVAVRSDTHKLIVRTATGESRLYDLAADPDETRDVGGEQPEQARRLLGYLEEWRRGLGPARHQEIERLNPETEESLRALGYIR